MQNLGLIRHIGLCLQDYYSILKNLFNILPNNERIYFQMCTFIIVTPKNAKIGQLKLYHFSCPIMVRLTGLEPAPSRIGS